MSQSTMIGLFQLQLAYAVTSCLSVYPEKKIFGSTYTNRQFIFWRFR